MSSEIDDRANDPKSAGEESGHRMYTHTLGVALVELTGLFAPESIEEAVGASWTAPQSIKYYGRDWFLSTILDQTERGFFGRIGFVREGDVSTLNFDPQKGDFIEGEASTGAVVPFFLSATGRLSYQVLSGQVAERTFLTVFERLMNSTEGLIFEWKVSELASEINYEDWYQAFGQIRGFDFTLDRPNPHYGDDDLIEKLVEGTGLENLRLVARAKGNSVDVDADLYRQSLDHVMRNYGRATITGVDSEGRESKWTKRKKMAGRALARFFLEGPEPAPRIDELQEAAVAELPPSTLTVPTDDEQDDVAG